MLLDTLAGAAAGARGAAGPGWPSSEGEV